jgi:1,4-dihydroxy-2-naphthoate octaprenyltransferase
VQHGSLPAVTWVAALAAGLPACGILLANNVRDVDTDRVTGKRTVAVRIGAARARMLYVVCIVGAIVAAVACGAFVASALLAVVALPLAVAPVRAMLTRQDPPGLIAALVGTVRFQLVLCVLLAIGLWAG